jgi:hypothetical protein
MSGMQNNRSAGYLIRLANRPRRPDKKPEKKINLKKRFILAPGKFMHKKKQLRITLK